MAVGQDGHSSTGMARYKLTLAYDGTAFLGSQRQARRRTVQGELEQGLHSLGWRGRSVILSGRTDTGVHAAGQVAALDFDWAHGTDALREALNANLPVDMAVSTVELAEPEFHPRYDATSRRYRYRLICQPVRDPLREAMAWRVWPALEEDLLEDAAKCLPGRRDFAGFGSAPHKGGDTVRTVTTSEWSCSGDEWYYQIVADGFLYHMVRRLVYAQVAVAQRRCLPGALIESLESGRRRTDLPAGIAPAQGLTLVNVDY